MLEKNLEDICNILDIQYNKEVNLFVLIRDIYLICLLDSHIYLP